MADKHRVRFEPVGIEIEVEEDESILDGAFRQGLMLPHGCKEGQCSSCKSFLLEGEEGMEVELGKYSTFALNDMEKDEGHVLLCRTYAYDDVVVELMNYDEELLRSGAPISTARTRITAIDPVTSDMRRLALELVEPTSFAFLPGQYVDVHVPDSDETRSFSMATTPSSEGHLEFVIKCYPGGRFSELLQHGLGVGDEIRVTGPYGLFTLRESHTSDIVFVGGGAGIAPVLSLLRSMDERNVDRTARFYYGARTEADLPFREEIGSFEQRLGKFTFTPALSHLADGEEWSGETGFVHDVVDRIEGDLTGCDAYVCGPPPMVEAAIAVLEKHGVETEHIYFDKFTTSVEADS